MSGGAPSLPRAVALREVGPRDGFQNEPEQIATADKVALIEMLGAAGFRRLEITSFVRADVIPQLADGAEVLAAVRLPEGVARSVIVPTPRGLDRALEVADRLEQITVFLSASDSHNRHNVNRDTAESLAGLETMLPRIRDAPAPPPPPQRQPRHRGVARRPGDDAAAHPRRRAARRGGDLDELRLSLRGPGAGGPRGRPRRAPGGGRRPGARARRYHRDGQ